MKYLNDLNEQQKEAVLHVDGPLLVFAGAGSGKTRVLTRRIAHLILEHNVAPSQIFAVTFTNKAAGEMKARVARLFSTPPSWVGTFHSSCARILRRHAELLNYQNNFAIYDSQDSLSVIKRLYKQKKLDPRIIEPKRVLKIIDRSKNQYRFPDDLKSQAYNPVEELTAEIYEAYQRELLAANAMDFGDLLCNVVTLLKLEPRVAELYHHTFRYLLIDEYQDTNHVQYLLIKKLAEDSENLCVVGDDDQSIYSFRGASIQNILNFQHDFPSAKIVTLVENYRSTQNILSAASRIIAKNSERQPKELTTRNPAGSKLLCLKSFDEREEGQRITDEILRYEQQGGSLKDIALFYRTNAQSRALEEALIEAGVPYEIYGGRKFYDRKEIKDVLAYLRLLYNPNDNEAFLRIINVPTRGLGTSSVNKVVHGATDAGMSFFSYLEKIVKEKETPLIRKLKKFHELYLEFQTHYYEASTLLEEQELEKPSPSRRDALASLLEIIAMRTEYIARLKKEESVEAEGRIENLYELFNVATEYVVNCDEQESQPSVLGFLERVSLSSDLDSMNEDSSHTRGSVSLMTLHLAKGLEFDVVFLTGLEEGLLPHVRSIDSERDLEEERRLCYVGMTRARKQLYLTRAISRTSYGRSNWYSGIASRFIYDLPSELIDDRGTGFIEWNDALSA